MKNPSLRTVADEAGVSVASVSNAYNRPDQLSDAVRERILATARELGYAGPDPAARSLRTRQVGAIGLLLSTPLEYALSDPYCMELMRGIGEVMTEHRTQLVLIPHADADSVHKAVVDAVIADGLGEDAPAVRATLDRHLPVALSMANAIGSSAYIDDYAAGRLIGEHLSERKLWDVTVLVGTSSAPGVVAIEADPATLYEYSRQREAGIRDGLGARGRVRTVGVGGNSREAGRTAAQAILAGESRPAAIAADSDVLALGVIDALEQRGLRPGADIAVAGFDDVALAEHANLTTVRQPIREKGRALARSLLDPTGTERETKFDAVLVPRGSTLLSTTEPSRPGPSSPGLSTTASAHAPRGGGDGEVSDGVSTVKTPDGQDAATQATDEWGTNALDLEAYLHRIGYEGPRRADLATLRAVHRGHVASIPFENLDLMLGRPIEVDFAAIQHKLVYRRRGGYCYEQNLLMAAVLERLGFPVKRWLARVGDPTDGPRPRSHQIATALVDGEWWLVDVGFGSGILEPLPLAPKGAMNQGIWTFEITQDPDGTWHLRELRDNKWTTRYTFLEEPIFAVDVTGANHITSTSAKSPFVQRPILVGRDESRERALIGRELSIADGERDLTRRLLTDEELGQSLEEHFGLRLSADEVAGIVATLT